jgi:hypothetical protein
MSAIKVQFPLRPLAFVLADRSPNMATPTLVKVPNEMRRYEFNFGDYPELRDLGQTLGTAPSIAVSPTGPSLGLPITMGNIVLCDISGGTDGIDYLLTVTVLTSGGATISGVAKLQVRAIP